jgi:hypothetical protein
MACRHLDNENKPAAERVAVYQKVYKALTGKDVAFEFPSNH